MSVFTRSRTLLELSNDRVGPNANAVVDRSKPADDGFGFNPVTHTMCSAVAASEQVFRASLECFWTRH